MHTEIERHIADLKERREAYYADPRSFIKDFAETMEEIPCGYIIDEEKGPSTLRVPKSPFPLSACYRADSGETVSAALANPAISDLQFITLYAMQSGLTHRRSHQAEAVPNQPAWLTYAMNLGLVSRMWSFRYNRDNTPEGGYSSVGGERVIPFLTKALEGGLDWWREHMDELVPTFPQEVKKWRKTRIQEEVQAILNGFPTGQRRRRLGEVVSEVLGAAMGARYTDNRPPSLFSAFGKWLSQFVDERGHGKIGAMVKDLKDGTCAPEVAEFLLALLKSERLKLRFFALTLQSSPDCTASRSSDNLVVEGLSKLVEELGSLDAAFDEVRKNARAIVVGKKEGTLWEIAHGILSYGVSVGAAIHGGGHMQQAEAERMRKVNWPHICIRHPDRREPHIHESFGDVCVYDLDTLRESCKTLKPSEYALLCDGNGSFLRYDEVSKVLRETFNDFAKGPLLDGLEELDEELQELFPDVLAYHGLDINKTHSVEVDDEHWLPLMDEDGDTNDDDRTRVEFMVGPDNWEMVFVDTALDHEGVAIQASAASIYNAYSDYSKQCWLVDRGLISRDDELHVKNHDPAVDLSANMLSDFVSFCHEASQEDGPWHSLGTYDGTGYGSDWGGYAVLLYRR